MTEFSALQEQIIKTNKDKVVVHSCAGSGKTRCLIGRLQFLLDSGVTPSNIVAVTFTNAAAEEIMERLKHSEGIFVGTVHSLANYYLKSHGIDTSDIISDEAFDELFERVKKNPQCIPSVEYLLLDEGQDSTVQQIEFLLKMINPKNWMVFADTRQSIFGFNDAVPEIILKLMMLKGTTVYDLNENYRNAPAILRFAKKLINGSILGDYELWDDSICMNNEQPGCVNEVEYLPSRVIEQIKADPHYGKWFVLTRTNSQLDNVVTYLTRAGIPCDTFKRSQITSEEFQEKMTNDTVKVLTVHSAKGLEADNVIVIGVSKWSKSAEERRVAYVAATRAREKLIWMRSAPKKRLQSWE